MSVGEGMAWGSSHTLSGKGKGHTGLEYLLFFKHSIHSLHRYSARPLRDSIVSLAHTPINAQRGMVITKTEGGLILCFLPTHPSYAHSDGFIRHMWSTCNWISYFLQHQDVGVLLYSFFVFFFSWSWGPKHKHISQSNSVCVWFILYSFRLFDTQGQANSPVSAALCETVEQVPARWLFPLIITRRCSPLVCVLQNWIWQTSPVHCRNRERWGFILHKSTHLSFL